MMISRADTTEMIQIAKELKTLSDDLDFEINALFTRFANVPNGTKEWIGDKARMYFEMIAGDKRQYLDLSRSVRRVGIEVLGQADELENTVNRNRRN